LFPFNEVEFNIILSGKLFHPGSQTSGYYFIDIKHRDREAEHNPALGTGFKNTILFMAWRFSARWHCFPCQASRSNL